jgi:hypothetical protein
MCLNERTGNEINKSRMVCCWVHGCAAIGCTIPNRGQLMVDTERLLLGTDDGVFKQ